MEVRRKHAEQKCWHSYLILALLILIIDVTKALPVSEQSTEPPPKPFRFKYEAGRAPGGKPDRYVEQEGDGSGQIRGSYTYLDPNWTWQTIKYQADPDGGFRILEGSTLGVRPKDTAAVQKAREEHETLFKMIALRNQQIGEQLEHQQVHPQHHHVQQQHQHVQQHQLHRQQQHAAALNLPKESKAVLQKRRQHAELFQKIAEEHRLLAEEHKRLAEQQSLVTSS